MPTECLYSVGIFEFLIFGEQKSHIQRNSKYSVVSADVVPAELDCAFYVVLFRVREDCLGALCVARGRFYLNQRCAAFVSRYKIDFQAAIFVVIVKLPTHFRENVRHKVFKDSPLVTVQIALQNIVLRAVFEHSDK